MTKRHGKPGGAADVLAIGFGTTVLMWTVGYVMRKPEVDAPGPVLGLALLLCVLVGGFLAGRLTTRGWRAGAMAGAVVAGLNLLIVGGTLAGEEGTAVSWPLVWVPGTVVVTAVVMALAAMVGGRYVEVNEPGGMGRDVEEDFRRGINWTGWFALVAVAATGLLLLAGGLVTGRAAGLAVPDWPQSFGYNMFLYPLARMTGNIYYEHTHRLVGALVGLTTIALAVHLWVVWTQRWWSWAAATLGVVLGLGGLSWGLMATDRLAWVPFAWLIGTLVMAGAIAALPAGRRQVWPWMAALAVVAVIAQGVLGGFRVSMAEAAQGIAFARPDHETAASTVLRVIHGVFGQVFFALIVALAVATTVVWQRARGAVEAVTASTDRALAIVLLVALGGQLLLGALVRHVGMSPLAHIVVAALLTVLAVAVGVRAWGLYGRREATVKRLGVAVLVLVGLQVVLGVAALVVTGLWPTVERAPTLTRLLFTTAHQVNGAALLGVVTAWMLLSFRVLREPDEPALPSNGEASVLAEERGGIRPLDSGSRV